MKLSPTAGLSLTLAACLLAGGSLRAENFAWNSDTNLQLFTDGKNWLAGGGPTASGPGASDDVISPALYGICSVMGEQAVNNFTVTCEKKWYLIGKGRLTIGGDLVKGGKDLIFRDGGNAAVNFEINVQGSLTLNDGLLRFGQDADNGELDAVTVEGPASVAGGELNFRCTSANLRAGLKMERGLVVVYNASGTGGITVNGIDGAEGTICATRDAKLSPEAILTIQSTRGPARFEGLLENGVAGTLALAKSGTGVQTLTNGKNSYSGGTTISEGILSIENTGGSATGTSTVQVNGGGILSGNGAVSGMVEVTAGGSVSPGTPSDPVGVLTLAGGLTMASDKAVIALQMIGSKQDQIAGAGKLRPGGKLVITVKGRVNSSAKLFNGFQVAPDAHFAEVVLTGDLSARFARSGSVWNAVAGSSRWVFDESTGALAMAP